MVEPLLQIPNGLHHNQSRPDLLSSSRCGLIQRQQDLLMKHQKYEHFFYLDLLSSLPPCQVQQQSTHMEVTEVVGNNIKTEPQQQVVDLGGEEESGVVEYGEEEEYQYGGQDYAYQDDLHHGLGEASAAGKNLPHCHFSAWLHIFSREVLGCMSNG